MAEISEFSRKVIEWIRKIPKGKVVTYGQIAKLAGEPHASRGVAWILHSSSKAYRLPWHRVVNAKGEISFPVHSSFHRKQKKLLENENVEFSLDGKINLKKFQWQKFPKSVQKNPKKPQMFK